MSTNTNGVSTITKHNSHGRERCGLIPTAKNDLLLVKAAGFTNVG
jgi:hypothetical protein